jgi:hypothetical protein
MSPSVALRRPPRRRAGAALAAIGVLALLGMAFLGWIGIDALQGRHPFQFFADSPTYHEAFAGGLDHISSGADLVGIAANFLGPMMLLALAGGDYYAMVVVNAALLSYATLGIARTLRIDALRLLAVLLLNPITISSLLAVNKEVISLAVVALLLRALERRSLGALALALAASVLVRWQLTLVVLATVALVGPLNPLRRRRFATVLLVLAALSAVYVALAPLLEPIRLNFEHATEDYEGSGLFERLVTWQDEGWYWLAFVPKAAHLLWGMGLRLDRLVAPTDVYNDVWQLLHSTSLLLLFLALWRAGKVRLANDLFYLSVLYIAIFALTPIYTPRYFYPVYVLWAAALLTPSSNALRLPVPRAPRPARRPATPSTPSSSGLQPSP